VRGHRGVNRIVGVAIVVGLTIAELL